MAEEAHALNWFGEGFGGFPKCLPDDCVEYTLYIINSSLRDAEIRSRLQEVQKAAADLTKKLTEGYIWQRDSFSLDLIRHNGMARAYLSENHERDGT